jgi:heat-inducible transcriptional repressor
MDLVMLDDRKAAILRAVVEVYIDTAQPVGSAHVTRTAAVDVSSATVRNEMAALEREGFLAQPHTSAGRIPTDKGYRFFVDTLDGPAKLGAVQTQQVKDFFARAHGEIEQMLAETSRLLSNVTAHTAVVVGPPAEAASLRSIQLVGLGQRTVLVVAVLSNAVVEKRTLELPVEIGDERIIAAGAHLAAHLTGRVLTDASSSSIPATGDQATDDVVDAALTALGTAQADEAEHVFVGGAARTAAAFDAVKTVEEILSILEQQLVVVGLLHDVLDRGQSVAIGAETGLPPLAECSLVVAPYEVEGERAGTVGILGPTRMNYPQALAAVAVVSQRLGRRLSEG